MPTEKEWKEICKGCHIVPLHQALGELANVPEYLRRLIEWYGGKRKYD